MQLWKRLSLGTAVLGIGLASVPAGAVVQLRDYRVAGDQNIIHDDALGLEFLRLPLTYELAPAQLTTLFPEFRVARHTEVTALLGNLGLSGLNPTGVNTYAVAVGLPVMATIGAMIYHDYGRGSTAQASYAYFLTDAGTYSIYNIMLATGIVQPNGMSVIYQAFGSTPYMRQRGTYLVREAPVAAPVPEPASWGLLIAGLGLIGARLRHRRQQGYKPA